MQIQRVSKQHLCGFVNDACCFLLSCANTLTAEDENVIQNGGKDEERRHHKRSIKGVKTRGLSWANKDFLMDIFDGTLWEYNRLVSLLTHMWLMIGGEY